MTVGILIFFGLGFISGMFAAAALIGGTRSHPQHDRAARVEPPHPWPKPGPNEWHDEGAKHGQ